MNDYAKQRVAIGVFDLVDTLCHCVGELTGILRSPSCFALVPSESDRQRLKQLAAEASHGRSGDNIIPMIRQGDAIIADPDTAGTKAGRKSGLTADHVVNFAGWIERGAAELLERHLMAGASLLFVQVGNPQQEKGAFEVLRNYVVDRVLLQDLPLV